MADIPGAPPNSSPLVEPVQSVPAAPSREEISRRLDALGSMRVMPTAQEYKRVNDAQVATGLPRDVVERNIDEAEEMARVQARPRGEEIYRQAPKLAEFMQDPDTYALVIDNLRDHIDLETAMTPPKPGFLLNSVRGVKDRTQALVGNFVQFIGEAGESLDQKMQDLGIPNPGIVVGDDGVSWSWNMPAGTPNLIKEVGQQVDINRQAATAAGTGYMPDFTWERFKGDMTAKNLAGYIAEQGVQSIPDMIAIFHTLPAYLASRTEELAEQRVANNGGADVAAADLVATMPAAVASAMLDRYSFRGTLGQLADKSKVVGVRGVFQEVMRSAAREGGTEAIQEAMEYTAETLGTSQDMSVSAMADRAIGAAVAGAGMGGVMRAPTATFQAVQIRNARGVTGEIESRFDQQSIDAVIDKAKNSTLRQGSKQKFAEYIRSLAGDEMIYMDPDAIDAADQAGTPLPQSVIDKMESDRDIALSYEEFSDLLDNDQLMATVRPFLKRAPLLMTQKELDEKQATRNVVGDEETTALIQKAVKEREVRSEVDRIAERIKDQLVATGRLREPDARLSVEPIISYVTTKVADLRAQGVKTSVADVYKALNFKVEKGAAGIDRDIRVLNQAAEAGYQGSNVVEAQEWMESVKKFGEEGMTQLARMERAQEMGFDPNTVWYHGTTAGEISAFRPAREGGAIFFAPRPELASDFAGGTEAVSMAENFGFQGNVMPVYLRAENTFDFRDHARVEELVDKMTGVDGTAEITIGDIPRNMEPAFVYKQILEGDYEIFESPEAIAAMKSLGYDSFYVREVSEAAAKRMVEEGRVDDPYLALNIGILDPTQIRSTNAAFNPEFAYSENILAQADRGEIDLTSENERIIRLFNTADPSTFLHETAHLFLEAEKQFAAQYGVTDNQKRILKHLGVKSFDEIGVEQHELFARTYEDYLRTGEAPSLRLRDAFAAFSRWLTQIYKNIRGALGLELSPEVKEMFDRLLATQAEIEEASVAPEYQQFFRSKEQAGMTDAEWKRYTDAVQRRKDRSQTTLEAKLLKEIRQRYTDEWREERRPIIDQWLSDLQGERVYQLIDALQSPDGKMDSAAVAEALGVDKVPAGRLLSRVKAGGIDPQIYVEGYGYDSLQQMLTELQQTKPIKERATEIAEEVMRDRHGDILNDGTIEAEAREAFHNEAQASLLLEEIRMLKRSNKAAPDINREVLKAEAKSAVQRMKPAEIKPDKYYRAEIRAAKRAAQAGSPKQAREHKIQQLANHYLYKEAVAARRELTKINAYVRGVKTRTYDTKRVNADYVLNMKLLANAYDMTNGQKQKARVERLLDWYEGQLSNADGTEFADLQLLDLNLVEALEARRTGSDAWKNYQPKRFRDMTLEESRSVYDMLRHMRHVGGILSDEVRVEDQKRVAGFIKNIIDNGGQDVPDPDAPGKWDRLREDLSHFINMIPSVRNLLRTMDGFEDANGHREIYLRLAEATNRKLALAREIHDRYEAELNNLRNLTLDRNQASEVTIQKENGGTLTLGSEGRVMLALYWGTESSREAIRQGHNVTDGDVSRMLANLTDDQVALVNSIWKVNESMWPELSAAGVRRYGVAPAKLAPAPFTVNGREMTGGHMRLFYQTTGQNMDFLEGDQFYSNSVTPTKAGSLIERVGSGGKKVLLDKHNIFRAIEDNIHFIAFSDAGVEIQKILGNKQVQQAIIQKHGRGYLRALKESVQGITVNKGAREPVQFLADAMRILRKAKVFAYLAYSIRNTVQQFSAAPIVASDVGVVDYASHLGKFYSNFRANKEFVTGKSEYMKNRASLVNREAAEFLNTITVEGRHVQMWEAFKRYGFTPQTTVDTLLAFPAWMSKYESEMASHGDDARAVEAADTLIAESIGSGADLHLGTLYRSNQHQFVRTLTMFGSWFNAYYQRMYRKTRGFEMSRQGVFTWDGVEAMLVTPMIVGTLAALLVMDAPGDDEDWATWAAKRYAAFIGGTLPILREIVSHFEGFQSESPLEGMVALPTDAYRALENVAKGEKSPEKITSDFIKVGTSVVPVPGAGNITRVLDYVDSQEQGKEDIIRTNADLLRESYQAVTEGPNRND